VLSAAVVEIEVVGRTWYGAADSSVFVIERRSRRVAFAPLRRCDTNLAAPNWKSRYRAQQAAHRVSRLTPTPPPLTGTTPSSDRDCTTLTRQ
jgi:hypothetical protein